jgi:phytoene desaturase
VEGYRKLAKHSQEIFDVGYTKLADQPFHRWSDMAKAIPDMIRLQNYRSVYSLVSKYIKDERLRQAFSFEPLLVGGNPFKITSIYLLIHWLERKWGVHFAKGGTTALVNAMVKVLESKNVEFHYNCPVDSLQIDKGRVSKVYSSTGVSFDCDLVVSNADPVKVYDEWIDQKWLGRNRSQKVRKKNQSMSLFVSYFGTKKKFDNIVHHTILLGPRYKGLLNDIFDKKNLADDFSLYLHAPTVTDQSLGPEGSETFYVLSPVPNTLSGVDWESKRQEYQDRIFESLEKRLLPGLKENLDVSFNITPDYFQNTLRSTHGSAFGIEPSLQQSAYFRFHNESDEVKGLYFVGANTHPGAGVPGVINSAKVLRRIVPSVEEL